MSELRCAQCAATAFYALDVGEGTTKKTLGLCLDCNVKYELAELYNLAGSAIRYNKSTRSLTLMDGIPRALFQIPTLPVYQGANFVLNKINISQSRIGTLNLGTIHHLDQSVTVTEARGDKALADAIARLAEGIAADVSLRAEQARDAIGVLSTIAQQLNRPPAERTPGILKPLLQALATIVQTAAAGKDLWTTYGPTISSAVDGASP